MRSHFLSVVAHAHARGFPRGREHVYSYCFRVTPLILGQSVR